MDIAEGLNVAFGSGRFGENSFAGYTDLAPAVKSYACFAVKPASRPKNSALNI